MITKSIDVLERYEIRKTKKQKAAFISAVTAYAERQRYTVRVEEGKMGCRNIVIGDPKRADYLLTAHYDTPASIGLPNFITPCNPVVFLLWQLRSMRFQMQTIFLQLNHSQVNSTKEQIQPHNVFNSFRLAIALSLKRLRFTLSTAS